MGTPGSASEVSKHDALRVFAQSDRPSTPFTTTEIADELDCPPETVRTTLEELAEQGVLHSRKLDDSTKIWWPQDVDETDESAAQGRFTHEQFSSFINAVTDYAIFLLDPDGTIASWNHGAERIKGYKESEIIGEHISAFYTQSDIDDGVPERNLEAAAEAGAVEDEGWRVRKDGSRFWANVTITAIRDDVGDLQGYTKVTRDMTDRREYERQLEEQAAQLKRQRDELELELDEVFERVDDAVYALDDEFRVTFVNERAEAYLGKSAGELLGRNIWEAFEVDDDDPIIERYETAMATQEATSFERYSDPLGIWAIVRVYPSPTGLSVYFRDITERKRAESKLRESEERFRTMMEQSPFSIQLFDAEGETIAANPAWERLWDAPRDELADYNILQDEQLEAAGLLSYIQDAFAGEAVTLPVVHYDPGEIGKPGRARWIEGYAYPLLPDEAGRFEVALVHHDITERKEREQELERYENAVETVWDGITILDSDDRFVLVNEAFCDITGYDHEEVIGEHATLILDESTYEQARELHEEVVEGTRDIATLEYDLLTADGGTVPVEARFGPVEYADGSVGGAGVIRDITERKERERELEEQRERFRRLMEAAPVTIATYCPDGTLTYVNQAGVDLMGVTEADELLGEAAIEFIHPDDRPAAAERMQRVIEGRESVPPKETRVVTPDGEVTHTIITGVPITHDGVPAGQVVLTDISERKERERALERYETLIQESADVNAILDPDGTLQYVTPSVEYVLGYEPEDLLGEDAFGYVHSADREQTRALFTALIDGARDTPKAEFRFRHDDGSWVWLEAHGRNLLDDPNIDGVVVYTRDVTDRKRYEERLNDAVDKLEKSNERLEHFASVASHDLQEPLRMVSSYLQLLEQRYAASLDDDAREFIEYAVGGAERMREMIDDLLAYSRVDTQAKPLEPTDCEAVIERVRRTLQVPIEESDAEIDTEPLPTVTADENQLEQVFQNLISNAIKYHGDDPPHIEIGAEREADEWVFRVADNGIGLDPDQADHIFEVFKRLHTGEEYPGTGIGLALSKKIVERHGGDIWVESDPGRGSTFYFTIPSAEKQQ